MPRYDTAANIVNTAAVECGLPAVSNPFASSDQAFLQLCQLLTSTGRELIVLFPWNKFITTYTVTTNVPPDTGVYTLPSDFGYMIDQTGWTPTNAGLGMPLGGPLSSQDWTYLVNTNLATSTVFVSFRMSDGTFSVLPSPPPDNVVINFEYMSRDWVETAGNPLTTSDKVIGPTDVVLFEPILIVKFLKLRYLESKGFDTTAAVGQFMTMFNSITGKDVSMPILTVSRMRIFPYLGYRNIPESNYGLP